jgi:hypothetical protein
MYLGYQRTGGIHYAQAASLGMVPFTRRHAMGAENDALALRHFVKVFDKDRAFPFERFEHEAVVYDLVTHIKRRAISA